MAQVWLPAERAQILTRGLAGDVAARVEDPGHDRRVDLRHIAFQNPRTVHHRHARHANIVLDRHRLARKRALDGALDIHFQYQALSGSLFGWGDTR